MKLPLGPGSFADPISDTIPAIRRARKGSVPPAWGTIIRTFGHRSSVPLITATARVLSKGNSIIGRGNPRRYMLPARRRGRMDKYDRVPPVEFVEDWVELRVAKIGATKVLSTSRSRPL